MKVTRHICRVRSSRVNEEYTIKALDDFENKNSSGHNGISNKLLKSIKSCVSKSLTIIINQMITAEIFPDAFKVSKVMPVFKKSNCFLTSNYKPTSLLPTISMIFKESFTTKYMIISIILTC